jgi:hypothetical protein
VEENGVFPESNLYLLAQAPATWGKDRILGPVTKSYGPATLVEVESRFSKYVLLLPLAAAVSVGWALAAMVVYGWVVTLLYEWLRARGRLEDPMETVNPVKGYLLGLQQLVYAKVIRRLGPERPHIVRWGAIGVGAALCGGVVAVHHYIRVAGYTGWRAVVGNTACRLMAVPQKFIEVTVTLGVISLVWSAAQLLRGQLFV